MVAAPTTLDVVRRAVRGVVERSTPELHSNPELRRRLASNMVGVSLAAAQLLEAERNFDAQARRAGVGAAVAGGAGFASRAGVDDVDTGDSKPAYTRAIMDQPAIRSPVTPTPTASAPPARTQSAQPDQSKPQLSTSLAAGDIHRQTAVNNAANVLQATRQAIDFPGFVTSLISGVFQAMTTSTIQQLEAYANLLEAINTSASAFGSSSITPGRAATWAAGQFPELEVTTGDPPTLQVREDAEMPNEAALRAALEATSEEVSGIDESDLESTLLPLVRRKLARDRQSMLATMVLMGMNRIVVDDGKIQASMELQIDARSTAEQTTADRFDTRVSTSGGGSFGMGMWGASASMSATVGYVKSDEQFTREDIALRAGLRSSVNIGFHTEPLQLGRFAKKGAIDKIKDKSMVPEEEKKSETLLTPDGTSGLLTADTRKTKKADFGTVPETRAEAPAPDSDEAKKLREKKDFSAPKEGSGEGGGNQTANAEAPTNTANTDNTAPNTNNTSNTSNTENPAPTGDSAVHSDAPAPTEGGG